MFGRLTSANGHYRVRERLLAGEYPAGLNKRMPKSTLRQLLDAGVTFFLDLTEEWEKGLPPYTPALRAEAQAMDRMVEHHRIPIPDFETPTVDQMRDILDTLDAALAGGHTVYVHCYAGIGRTGTVVGCYLVRHGKSGIEALDELTRLRHGSTLGDSPSPVTDEQRRLVYYWAAFDPSPRRQESDGVPATQDDRLPPKATQPLGKTGGHTPPTGVPRVDVSERVEKHPRADTREAASIQPYDLGRTLTRTKVIAGIAAVIALFVVTLAASRGQISLSDLQRGPAMVDLDVDNLQGADLQGAYLRAANLAGANLRGANAQGANLRRAILVDADLHYALLNEADLREADLRGANLQWVDLADADLSEAQLEGANLENARLDNAILPDGSRWAVSGNMRRFTDPTYENFWRP